MRFEPGKGEGVPDPASCRAEEAQRVVGRELLLDAVDDLAVVPAVSAALLPNAGYTVAPHRSSRNIADQTARTDSLKLEKRLVLSAGNWVKHIA